MEKRIANVKQLLTKHNLDAILVSSKANKFYLNALTGSGVKVLITKDHCYQIMDGRYINEAKKMTTAYENIVYEQGASYLEVVKKIIGEKTLGIEANHTLTKEYLSFKQAKINVFLLDNELEQIRACKDEFEIKTMQKACQITDEVFLEVLKKIHVGMSELELLSLIQYLALNKGASKMAFEPIVASGFRSAMPHGRATTKKFAPHEFITIDFGVVYQGYQSDMTRTISLGEPSLELRKIYDTVLTAQKAGIAYIKEGLTGQKVDAYVREIIKKNGFVKYFTHGLGHGMGIGDGELPLLNSRSQTVLKEGMVMSCEPGIYVPDVGGVRIEDDVLIRNGVGVALNKAPKDLIILEVK